MNDLPPKIAGASKPTVVKSPKPLAPAHVILGIAAGCVAGALLATLFWLVVGMCLFQGRLHTQPLLQAPPEPVATEPAVEMSEASEKATIAEIDAVTHLTFEQNKLAQFDQIAGRPNLSPNAQVHLVEAALKQLTFENNRLQVLTKLIANPAFSPTTKEQILKDLSGFSFENNKQSLLDAMNRRDSQR